MTYPNFGHDGNSDSIHDLLDHLRVTLGKIQSIVMLISSKRVTAHHTSNTTWIEERETLG